MARFGFLYDQALCTGCNACQVACKDANDLERGLFFRRADTLEFAEDGRLRVLPYSGACNHCERPACVKVCPSGAMYAAGDGTVLHDAGRCGGCGACVKACPYGAVKLSLRKGTAAKCDGCFALRGQGKRPVCVDACPTHCLNTADFDALPSAAPDGYEAPFFSFLPDPAVTGPAVRVRKRAPMETAPTFAGTGKKNVFLVNDRKPVPRVRIPGAVRPAEEYVREAAAPCASGREATVWGLFAAFFANREQAAEIFRLLPDWQAHTPEAWAQEYDDLFCGTDCSREVLLWASASRGERILLDRTTLEVIRFYHRYGYVPVRPDGNPPDFIGEQCRFLCYLFAAEASGKAVGIPGVRAAFVQSFLKDTVETAAEGVLRQTALAGLRLLFAGLKELAETGRAPEELVTLTGRWSLPEELRFEEVRAGGLLPPAATEQPHEIATAGLGNCGGICVIRPTAAEDCILSIRTDDSQNAPQLRACVRGRGYRRTFLNPSRLRFPMKRVGERGSGRFRRISWEEAVELIAENWKRIRKSGGPSSTYSMYATGVTGVMRPGSLLKRLLSLDGGYLDYFNSYSSACSAYVSPYMFGSRVCGSSPDDILNTKLLILWGSNPAETVFGTEFNDYLAKAKKKGIRMVVIDPRLSQTAAAWADEWIAPRPATDGALADAMAYVIWSEGLCDRDFLDRFCLGFDGDHMPEGVPKDECCLAWLTGEKDGTAKTPEWAARITGVEAETIRRLARAYGSTHPAAIISGLGPQRHANGEQTVRSVALLSCMTGNVGIPGGGTGANYETAGHRKISLKCSVNVSNPYPGKIPTFLWTKAIEHGTEMTPRADRLTGADHLDSNIRLIFNLAGNTLINQHSDINDTVRILKDETKCEFIVTSDIFLTPSARYSDLVLPAASVLECENIVNPWQGSNYLLKNNPVTSPLFESRFEWEWLKELSRKLGLYAAFTEGKPSVHEWLTESYEALRETETELPDYETFSRLGGWQYRKPVHFLAFEEQIRDFEHHPFATPSGKIELFSRRLYDFGQADIPAIPRYLPCPEGPEDPLIQNYPLQLIGWHTRRRCHSVHDNNEWQEEVERPGLWIHPEDAAARGIADGDPVCVFNDRGRVEVPAIVTRRIRPGVTALSQGGWYTPRADGTEVRGSVNVLTSARPTPLAKGNPQHTNLVEVRRADEGRRS